MPDEAEKGIDPVLELNPKGERSLLDLLVRFAEHRGFILKMTLGVAVLTAIVSMILPLRYTAESSLLPPQASLSGMGMLSQLAGSSSGAAGGLAALASGGLGTKGQIEMYVSMFRSRTVEDAMIQRFNLQKVYKYKTLVDTRKYFERKSTVVAGTKDGIIRVTVEGRTPDEASVMTNAYVQEFKKLASTVAVTEAAQRRVFFDRQLEDAKNNLAAAEQDLKKTELTSGMIQPDSQSRVMIESAAILQGQLAAKEVELQSLSSYATESNPDVVIVKRQIDELRSQLARYTGNTGSISDLFVPKGKVPEAALDYVRKLREVKYRETIFDAMAGQYQLARLDEAREGSIFQIIDLAVPPDKRSFPKRAILVAIATILAFFMACFIVWVRDAYEELRKDPEDGPKLSRLLATWHRPRAE